MSQRPAGEVRGRLHSERGSFLLWGFAINAIFLTFIVGFAPFLQNVIRVPWFSYERNQGLGLAEAGMDWVLADIGAVAPSALSEDWVPATDCDALDGVTDAKAFGLAITTCDRYTPPTPLTAGDGSGEELGTFQAWIINYGEAMIRVISRGAVGELASPKAVRHMAVDLMRPGMFDHAAFGANDLFTWNESHIDSYDATLGAYDPVTNKTQDGDLGTNGDNTDPAPDVSVDLNPAITATVEGDIWRTPGDTTYVNPLATFTGTVQTRTDIMLPHVVVDPTLESLPFTTASGPGWSGFSGEDGQGHFICANVTCICDKPVRVHALKVDGVGVLEVRDGCQLFVDRQGTSSPYTWAPDLILDINGDGAIRKMNSGSTNQIFIRDGGFNFDGPQGTQWASSVPAAERLPEQFQIYVTCETPPCNGTTSSAFAQGQPFHGVVYVEDGNLDLIGGVGNLADYEAHYYGAFVAGNRMNMVGIYEDRYLADGVTWGQDGVFESFSMHLHYDASLGDLMIDGTGRRGRKYAVRDGSWRIW
jgi:hypothetical protein